MDQIRNSHIKKLKTKKVSNVTQHQLEKTQNKEEDASYIMFHIDGSNAQMSTKNADSND